MVSPKAFITDFGECLSIQLSSPIRCYVSKSIIEHPEPVSIHYDVNTQVSATVLQQQQQYRDPRRGLLLQRRLVIDIFDTQDSSYHELVGHRLRKILLDN